MEIGEALVAIGALLLAGLGADTLGRATRIPRVTLLILLGILLGHPGLDVIPDALIEWYEFLAVAALSMVAFTLGGELTRDAIRAHGREIVMVSLAVVVASFALVGGGLALLGVAAPVALMLAAASTATDPAAVRDVTNGAGGRGPFIGRLNGIVAIDDAWGLIAFGLALAAARSAMGDGAGEAMAGIVWEIGGALAVGAALGLPAAYLSGRIRPGEPTQLEILGVVLLCAGLAQWLAVSFLLAGMVAGALVANLARHHTRPFHEIENVQGPFLIIFFLFAGASLQAPDLGDLGWIAAAYVALRVAGRALGGWAGGAAAGMAPREGLRTGLAMTPQAGIALGMALVAGEQFPAHRDALISVVALTTIFFEILGPVATRLAIGRDGR